MFNTCVPLATTSQLCTVSNTTKNVITLVALGHARLPRECKQTRPRFMVARVRHFRRQCVTPTHLNGLSELDIERNDAHTVAPLLKAVPRQQAVAAR